MAMGRSVLLFLSVLLALALAGLPHHRSYPDTQFQWDEEEEEEAFGGYEYDELELEYSTAQTHSQIIEDIIAFPSPRGKIMFLFHAHITEQTLALMERIIKSYSPSGETPVHIAFLHDKSQMLSPLIKDQVTRRLTERPMVTVEWEHLVVTDSDFRDIPESHLDKRSRLAMFFPDLFFTHEEDHSAGFFRQLRKIHHIFFAIPLWWEGGEGSSALLVMGKLVRLGLRMSGVANQVEGLEAIFDDPPTGDDEKFEAFLNKRGEMAEDPAMAGRRQAQLEMVYAEIKAICLEHRVPVPPNADLDPIGFIEYQLQLQPQDGYVTLMSSAFSEWINVVREQSFGILKAVDGVPIIPISTTSLDEPLARNLFAPVIGFLRTVFGINEAGRETIGGLVVLHNELVRIGGPSHGVKPFPLTGFMSLSSIDRLFKNLKAFRGLSAIFSDTLVIDIHNMSPFDLGLAVGLRPFNPVSFHQVSTSLGRSDGVFTQPPTEIRDFANFPTYGPSPHCLQSALTFTDMAKVDARDVDVMENLVALFNRLDFPATYFIVDDEADNQLSVVESAALAEGKPLL